jgi:uncharacterized protein involved in outer membrane biogenesis
VPMKKVRIDKPLATVLVLAAVLLAIPFALILWIESEPGQRFIEARASAATGREIHIGDIDIKVGWHPGAKVTGLQITNPPWAKTSHLIDTKVIDGRIRLLPLFKGLVVVDDLTLVQAKVGLEREKDRNTWTFKERKKKDDNGPQRVFVQRVNIDKGFVVYRDTTIDTNVEMDVSGDVAQGGGTIDVVARGAYRGNKLHAVANFPGLLPTPDTAVEMSAALAIGSMTVAAAGTVRAADVDGIDLDLDVSGGSLGDIKKLAPVNLPDTPPYRLQGRFRNPAGAFIFDPFEGRVGDSDLQGSARYEKGDGGKKVPLLRAKLVSHLLDFDDLGPIAGAPPSTKPGETAAPKQKAQAKAIDATGKVLPQKRYEVEDFPLMDADVNFEGKKIVDAAYVPIEDLSVHWTLKDGVLRFEPMKFRLAHGQVTANISLDSNKKPVVGKANIELAGLRLGELFPPTSKMTRPLGDRFGRVDITGHGTSAADLMASSDGRLAMLVSGGYISDLIMEATELDVAQVLKILATKDENEKLRCAIVDLKINKGLAKPQAFVVDTAETVINIDGSVDFRNESLDLKTRSKPKHMSPFKLHTPIVVQGPFKKPGVKPEIGPLALQGAAAIALGAINPILSFLPFVEPRTADDTNCGQLVAEVRKEGVKEVKK